MRPTPRLARALLGAAVALAAALAPAPALAQEGPAPAADTLIVYRREVFEYVRAGRADPFRSLVRAGNVGVRAEELVLRGVVYSTDPSRSVAILSQAGVERRIRARVGDRIGGVRVAAIRPRGVDVVVEELGVARRVTLELKPTPSQGTQQGTGQ